MIATGAVRLFLPVLYGIEVAHSIAAFEIGRFEVANIAAFGYGRFGGCGRHRIYFCSTRLSFVPSRKFLYCFISYSSGTGYSGTEYHSDVWCGFLNHAADRGGCFGGCLLDELLEPLPLVGRELPLLAACFKVAILSTFCKRCPRFQDLETILDAWYV